MNIKIILGLFSIIFVSLLLSCSEEKVINDSGSDKDILAISYDNNSHFTRVKFPSGTVASDDLFYEKNSSYLTSSKVENVRLFLKYVFVCIPDENKIVVIDKNTFTTASEISFASEGLSPVDIAFANATEGYVIFKDSPKVALLDIYYFKVAKYIELKGNPSAISAVGNQIYVTLPLIDLVSVIDSRFHEVVEDIVVDNVPYLIYPTIDGKIFVVLSAGIGKVPGDPRDAFSAPSVSLIEIENRKILKTNIINTPGIELLSELPSSFIITNNDWAFILTGKYLIRLDTRDPNYSNRVEQFNYKQIYHNNVYNELFVLENSETNSKIYKLNPVTGKKLENISLNKNILKITLY